VYLSMIQQSAISLCLKAAHLPLVGINAVLNNRSVVRYAVSLYRDSSSGSILVEMVHVGFHGRIIRPYEADRMKARKVGSEVENVLNNRPELCRPRESK
jgi:hypothetical protein